jgi:hypothetical protein
MHDSGAVRAAGMRSHVNAVIARSDSDEAIQKCYRANGLDCFVAIAPRNDGRASHPLLPGGGLTAPALLLLLPLLLPLLLVGAMAAVEASGGGTEHAVMSRVMAGDAADRGAFQAALGDGRICSKRKRRESEQSSN